ncbi:hypothetical protein [Nocardia arizonensis]|uniref:hypothetical protein n=1 Tax=Nocardia arizonensis TaxID=1141647 RepID=UPI0006D1A670|nr:hypothetical protein [Nocardia arizonensis]
MTWSLRPEGTGTVVTQHLTFAGPSAPVARAVAGSLLEADGRVVFARLALAARIEPAPDALTVVIAGGTGALGRNLATDLLCRGRRSPCALAAAMPNCRSIRSSGMPSTSGNGLRPR